MRRVDDTTYYYNVPRLGGNLAGNRASVSVRGQNPATFYVILVVVLISLHNCDFIGCAVGMNMPILATHNGPKAVRGCAHPFGGQAPARAHVRGNATETPYNRRKPSGLMRGGGYA